MKSAANKGMALNLSSNHISLVHPTEKEKCTIDELTAIEWGTIYHNVQWFKDREQCLRATKWAQEHMETWALRATSDQGTSEIVCSLETFRMPVIDRPLNGESIREGYSYGVASVFTPIAHRKKGYASKLLAMVMDVLIEKDPFLHSFHLYSEVGASLYSRLGFSQAHTVQEQVAGDYCWDYFLPTLKNSALNEFRLSGANQWIPFSHLSEVQDFWNHSKAAREQLTPYETFRLVPTWDQIQWRYARATFNEQYWRQQAINARGQIGCRPLPFIGGRIMTADGSPSKEGILWLQGKKRKDQLPILQVLWLSAESEESFFQLMFNALIVAHKEGQAGVKFWSSERVLMPSCSGLSFENSSHSWRKIWQYWHKRIAELGLTLDVASPEMLDRKADSLPMIRLVKAPKVNSGDESVLWGDISHLYWV